MILMVYKPTYTGWWFGIFFYDFPEAVGNGKIIPTDELIFFRGVGIPPTRYADWGSRILRTHLNVLEIQLGGPDMAIG